MSTFAEAFNFGEVFLSNWPKILTALLLLFILVISIVTLAIQKRSLARYEEEIDGYLRPVRIIVINIPKQTVRYMLSSDPRSLTKEMPISEFYARIKRKEQSSMKDWLESLAEGKDDLPMGKESDLYVGKDRKLTAAYFRVDVVRPKKGIIHLSIYTFRHLPCGIGPEFKSHGLAQPDAFRLAIAEHRRKGISLFFRFVHPGIGQSEIETDPFVMLHVRDILFSLKKPVDVLLPDGPNVLHLCIRRNLSTMEAEEFANLCMAEINRFFALNSLDETVKARCAVVEHRFFSTDKPEEIIKIGEETATAAFYDDAPVLRYEIGQARILKYDENSYRTEIERIIANSFIVPHFRPIYDVAHDSVFGYMMDPRPINTVFASLKDIHTYATKTGDDRALFQMVTRNALATFLNENTVEGAKLFYPVFLEDRRYMLTSLARYNQQRNTNVVFLHSQDDVHEHLDPNHIADFISSTRDVRVRGYEVGLLIADAELTLPESAYHAYDYFVVSFSFAGETGAMDTKVRSKLHGLVEKLIKYKKPIITTDIEDWESIEVIVRSKLPLISSEVFAPYDTMLPPPPSKSIRKIRDMKD